LRLAAKVKGIAPTASPWHESFNTYVAQIVEVSDQGGFPKVPIRSGALSIVVVAVNPNVIRAQIEGGAGLWSGLGSVRRGHTWRGGNHRGSATLTLPHAAA